MEHLFRIIFTAFEVVGVLAITVGFIIAALISWRTWVNTRNGHAAFKMMRESFGGVILLGLEILVAADLVKTVAGNPSLNDVLVLAIIVGIRTVLSFSLQMEIDGVSPWRRALVTGPQIIAQAAGRSAGDAVNVNEF